MSPAAGPLFLSLFEACVLRPPSRHVLSSAHGSRFLFSPLSTRGVTENPDSFSPFSAYSYVAVGRPPLLPSLHTCMCNVHTSPAAWRHSIARYRHTVTLSRFATTRRRLVSRVAEAPTRRATVPDLVTRQPARSQHAYGLARDGSSLLRVGRE